MRFSVITHTSVKTPPAAFRAVTRQPERLSWVRKWDVHKILAAANLYSPPQHCVLGHGETIDLESNLSAVLKNHPTLF